MSTVNRTIQNDYDRDMAAKLVANRPYPFTLSITDGKHRSTAQNRLQNMWFKEIAEQKGDITPAEARAYCKLTIGIPILRDQNEAFRIRYDEIVKPLPYEQKIAFMSEPLNLPVTSLMNTKQFTEYLDGIIRHFGEQGIVLTMPDDIRQELYRNTDTDETALSQSVDAGMKPAEVGAESPSDAPASELPDDVRNHFIDFARKALKTAGDDQLTAEQRKSAIDDMVMNYRDVIPESLWSKLSGVHMPIQYVLVGKRTIDQARSYIAKDLLDCKPSDLGGVDG